MTPAEIEEFVRTLIEVVRDDAVPTSHAMRPPYEYEKARGRFPPLDEVDPIDDLMSRFLVHQVDYALFYFMHALDDGRLRMSFVSETGETTDVYEFGKWEKAGWYASLDWPGRFSRERIVDYDGFLPPDGFREL